MLSEILSIIVRQYVSLVIRGAIESGHQHSVRWVLRRDQATQVLSPDFRGNMRNVRGLPSDYLGRSRPCQFPITAAQPQNFRDRDLRIGTLGVEGSGYEHSSHRLLHRVRVAVVLPQGSHGRTPSVTELRGPYLVHSRLRCDPIIAVQH